MPHAEEREHLLAVYLLDLHSQYEELLRELTHAQRALEEYRSAADFLERGKALERLRQRLGLLKNACGASTETLAAAERQIALLGVEEHS